MGSESPADQTTRFSYYGRLDNLNPSQRPFTILPKLISAMQYQRTWHSRLFYRFCYYSATLFFSVFFRLRIVGRENLPDGPALVCSNHQSHLDPVLVGIACREPISFLARDSLFKGPFALLINYLGAIPINREGTGLGGIKLTLGRLKSGEKVLIFPEGTRTPDGQMRKPKGGFSVIARKSKIPMVPIAIEGAFEAWPRKQWLPLPRTIQMAIGQPITSDEIVDNDDDQLLEILEQRMRSVLDEAKQLRQHRVSGNWSGDETI